MKKILLIGEYCLDKYVLGHSDRLSPEAPVPVFVPTKSHSSPGMAGNVLKNLEALKDEDTTIDHLFFKTGVKNRYVDENSGYQMFRVDEEPQFGKDAKGKTYGTKLEEDIMNYDMIIISDYNKGFIDEDVMNMVGDHPNVLVDTKKRDLRMFKNSLIKINEKENSLVEHNHLGELVVTLGKEGCKYNDNIYSTRVVNVIDVTGAGDSFLSGLAIKYLESKSIEESIKYANMVSSVAVSKHGTSTVSREEVEAIYNGK